MDNADLLKEDISYTLKKINGSIYDLIEIGGQLERISIFEALRKLIIEKESSGDTIAVETLSWAYEQLADY